MQVDLIYPEAPPSVCTCMWELGGNQKLTHDDCPLHGEDILFSSYPESQDCFSFDGAWQSAWVGVLGYRRHLHQTIWGHFTHEHDKNMPPGDRPHNHPLSFLSGRSQR